MELAEKEKKYELQAIMDYRHYDSILRNGAEQVETPVYLLLYFIHYGHWNMKQYHIHSIDTAIMVAIVSYANDMHPENWHNYNDIIYEEHKRHKEKYLSKSNYK